MRSGWSPRCAGCSRTLTHPEGARLACTFSWIKMRHDGGFRARPWAGCRRMPQQADDLWSILFFCRRSRLCVCDVRPWKGIVERKGAEVAAATVPPAVAPLRKAAYGRPYPRAEADSIDFDVWAGSKEMDLWRKAVCVPVQPQNE